MLTTDANGLSDVLAVVKNRPVELAPNMHVRYCRRIFRHTVSPDLLALLASYIRSADLVHLTAVYNFPTFPTFLTCRVLRKPLVWSPRGALQRWKDTRRKAVKRVWERACSIVAPHRTVLHVTSETERVDSSRRLPGLPTAVIPNGVKIPENATLVPRNGPLRLVYLGRLEPKKGLENLLLACRALADLGLSFSLAVGGSGDAKFTAGLKARAAALSLGSIVAFVGPVARDAKGLFFGNADLAVVPSHVENFCGVVAEALAHGVPVLASHGTPWSRIEQVGCGLWVKNDPESLAIAIQQIARKPLQEMGERGRRWMIAEYSWPAIAQQMFALYSSLLIGE